jgi:drug/metabolite transporter (DMT)-like permease
MSWLVFAFSGPVFWAMSTHFDKYLVEQYFKHSDTAVLLLFTAVMGVLTLPLIAFYAGPVTSPGPGSIALIMLSGVLYMGALLLYLRALQAEEASVVAPFFQAAPLFGYVLAYFVLGETLSSRQLAGGVLIIGGTLIASLRFGGGAGMFKLRLAMLMLACGLALALSGLIFKVFAVSVDFWVTTFWLFAGEAVFGCAILAVAQYRRQFVAVLGRHPGALITISGVNEVLNLAGALGFRYALLFAPLSIVQAIGATTTLFVFAFGVTLSTAFPRLGRETLSARDLVQKGAAAILVAGGVALVTHS